MWCKLWNIGIVSVMVVGLSRKCKYCVFSR